MMLLGVAWADVGAARPPADPCEAWAEASLRRRLDARTGSEEQAGNRVELLVDGVASYARRRESLADADLVLVKTFLWNDDAVGREIAGALAARARAGARVVVQYDFKANAPTAQVLSTWLAAGGAPPPPPPLDQLAAAGALVVPTNVPDRPSEVRRTLRRAEGDPGGAAVAARFRARGGLGEFDHEKYWITGHRTADGVELRAIVGGLNVGSEYAYGGTSAVDPATGRGGWRDTDVEVRGPVAEVVAARFYDLLDLHGATVPAELSRTAWLTPQAPAGEAVVRFVWSQPGIGRLHTVERLYRTLVHATPELEPLHVGTAYFAPHPRTYLALRQAARRGVGLSVLTNSEAAMDVPFVGAASLAAFEGLLRVDPAVALYHWPVQEGAETYHAKVASFGRCGPAIVGSANLDGLSAQHNSESVLLIRDPAFRAAFDTMYVTDTQAARLWTLGDAEQVFFLERWWQAFLFRVGWYWL